MSAQNNYAHPIYQQRALANISNQMILPIIRENQTNILQTVHGANMSSWVVNNASHMNNNNLSHQNNTLRRNSSLNFVKQEHTAYVLPPSLNIWLTHGL